jgi:hypothetical protein
VRLLRRESEHPQLKTTYPRFAAAIEWAKAGASPAAALEAAAGQLASQATNRSQESFRKRFGLLREDCFPD